MKTFDVPEHYRSAIIGRVKAKRKLEDPRKKDFGPSYLKLGNIEFIIPRHFGFCYGVENAIEKSYSALKENPDKRIYLLSQMIHNPMVNKDLEDLGITFLQDTEGNELMDWSSLKPEDIVIIPAFGATLETESRLKEIGVEIDKYNTTCPFVEKVWNRSAKLGEMNYTVIIHGKHQHEETKATFSHTQQNSPSLVILNMNEARILGETILGERTTDAFRSYFEGKFSADFDPEHSLVRIGVVNQTTMLASETQEITDYLRQVMITKYGESSIKDHIADTRDTLCYATNDNQTATIELLKEDADLAIVVGGYNSSNTSHLVELLEDQFPSYFIKDSEEIESMDQITSFDIHKKELIHHEHFLPKQEKLRIIITSGASCPDSAVDQVIQKILHLRNEVVDLSQIEI
jgi:4-hydroxy-3-methylbut-2-en-1-yl diphosphate reductase